MELYYFYNMAMVLAATLGVTGSFLPTVSLAIGGVLWLAVFLLEGIGVSTMAKNRGIQNRLLAFIPFANIWYIGKLAGECQFFGQKLKRAGMYAMIAQIILFVLTLATISAEIYLWTMHGAPTMGTELGAAYWPGLSGFSLTVSKFYELSDYLMSIFQLICEILLLILFMSLYKKYQPKNYFALSMLTLFVPVSRYFIVFALRKRKAVDFEAYERARREAYIRRRQQYYNPYQPPYGGGYNQNPYGQNAGQASPKKEEPFSEFSSQKNEDSDGFFN